MVHILQEWKDGCTMIEPATAPWDVSISEADFAKLIAGVESRNMDERWNVWSEERSHDKIILVHFARSWTGNKVYILELEKNDGDGDTGGKIKRITWTQKLGRIDISEEQGKRDAIITTRGLLGCTLEAFPAYDPGELYKPASTDAFERRKREEQANGSGNEGPP